MVEFCWIRGSSGIRGNELADSLVELASTHQEQFVPIHYQDWFTIINSKNIPLERYLTIERTKNYIGQILCWRMGNQLFQQERPNIHQPHVHRTLTDNKQLSKGRGHHVFCVTKWPWTWNTYWKSSQMLLHQLRSELMKDQLRTKSFIVRWSLPIHWAIVIVSIREPILSGIRSRSPLPKCDYLHIFT